MKERTRISIAKIFDSGCLLLLTNLLVLLLVSGSLQSLPGETTPQEVHENMTQSLQVISSRLLTAQVCVDTHVASSARQGLALAVRDVLLGLGVTVLLGHAEIDDMDDVGGLGRRAADEEVVRLDIAVDQVLLMNCLHARKLDRWDD